MENISIIIFAPKDDKNIKFFLKKAYIVVHNRKKYKYLHCQSISSGNNITPININKVYLHCKYFFVGGLFSGQNKKI